jgi:hypothetical protein
MKMTQLRRMDRNCRVVMMVANSSAQESGPLSQ